MELVFYPQVTPCDYVCGMWRAVIQAITCWLLGPVAFGAAVGVCMDHITKSVCVVVVIHKIVRDFISHPSKGFVQACMIESHRVVDGKYCLS